MDSTISATDAARTFSELLNRVKYRGDSFTIERAGEAVCRLVPVTGAALRRVRDLPAILARAPRPDDAYLDETEAFVRAQGDTPGDPWER